MRTLYIDPEATTVRDRSLRVHHVSNLLRELILALSAEPIAYENGSRGDYLAKLIASEIERASDLWLGTPLPRDAGAGGLGRYCRSIETHAISTIRPRHGNELQRLATTGTVPQCAGSLVPGPPHFARRCAERLPQRQRIFRRIPQTNGRAALSIHVGRSGRSGVAACIASLPLQHALPKSRCKLDRRLTT
jgi:hypothetical protein